MTKQILKQILSDCCNEVVFSYCGKSAGITSRVNDFITTFQAWYGSETKEYKDIETVMTDSFFHGKSLEELIGEVDFEIL